MTKEEDKKEYKYIQKLILKGETVIVRYANSEGTQTEWFVARKLDGTYQMYHLEDDKVVKVGKKSVNNPMELEKYVDWIKTE